MIETQDWMGRVTGAEVRISSFICRRSKDYGVLHTGDGGGGGGRGVCVACRDGWASGPKLASGLQVVL